ncbi:MAG: P-II family nitrogen regulator [Gammaproteobacteria bacterium]|nr:P-II family nitrogen regulator [Gammaproteobacteria bacterium]MCI0590408.1 P-II family nitrogen regulator [Gammaproteobacteria bacterium]
MKEIKAFVHRHRVSDIIHALGEAGFHNLSIVDVKGMLQALGSKEQDYSIELGGKFITEVKLELVCEDDQMDDAVLIIRENAQTGQPTAGWIYVSDILEALSIDRRREPR